MSIYELKPKFQNLLRPLARRLYSAGVTANQVTLIACNDLSTAWAEGVNGDGIGEWVIVFVCQRLSRDS